MLLPSNMPPYVSLKNQANNQYRYDRATHMQSNYQAPTCVFNLLPYGDGSYAIKNMKNQQYFDCTITSMNNTVDGPCQRWRFIPVPGVANGFFIQNVQNGKMMTVHASELSENQGSDEIYIIEGRGVDVQRFVVGTGGQESVDIRGTGFWLEANFKMDDENHVDFESLDGKAITLTALPDSTAWWNGSSDEDMPIYAGRSFPSYNSGVYHMKSKDGSVFKLRVTHKQWSEQ